MARSTLFDQAVVNCKFVQAETFLQILSADQIIGMNRFAGATNFMLEDAVGNRNCPARPANPVPLTDAIHRRAKKIPAVGDLPCFRNRRITIH